MTPEDIEALKQLKQLVDTGVLSPDDFEVQKRLIFSSAESSVVGSRRRLDELLPGSDGHRPIKSTNETVLAAQRAAVRVQSLSILFAIAGIIFGIVLMTQKDEYNETNPYVGAGIGVAVNGVVLAIVLFAIGKYMEARLLQGSDAAS